MLVVGVIFLRRPEFILWRLSDVIIHTMPRSATSHVLSPCCVSVIDCIVSKKSRKVTRVLLVHTAREALHN